MTAYTCQDHSLSVAWARAFLAFESMSGTDAAPFLVSVRAEPSGEPVEDQALRYALDACLAESDQQSVERVAKTIFPQALWKRARGDRKRLYRDYLDNLPDYVAMEPHKNSLGLYFARLVGYGIDPKTGDAEEHLRGVQLKEEGNQLEFLINSCHPGAQRMALQAGIYDPVRDQTAARRHFPCLQQISLVPDFARKTLSLNAFYALQLLFPKAYGNWLGLMRLGAFLGGEVGLTFEQLHCYAGIQKMDHATRPRSGEKLSRLRAAARACVSNSDSA